MSKFLSMKERLLAHVRYDPNGCWVWTGSCSSSNTKYGQLRVACQWKNKYKTLMAHRVAYEVFIGPIPEGFNVCHTCDNPPCINPSHLFTGTQTDNMRDAARKGRVNLNGLAVGRTFIGKRAWRRKLSDEQVQYILNNPSLTLRHLGEKFGVHNTTIHGIRKRKSWSYFTASS